MSARPDPRATCWNSSSFDVRFSERKYPFGSDHSVDSRQKSRSVSRAGSLATSRGTGPLRDERPSPEALEPMTRADRARRPPQKSHEDEPAPHHERCYQDRSRIFSYEIRTRALLTAIVAGSLMACSGPEQSAAPSAAPAAPAGGLPAVDVEAALRSVAPDLDSGSRGSSRCACRSTPRPDRSRTPDGRPARARLPASREHVLAAERSRGARALQGARKRRDAGRRGTCATIC